ncbi:hypothetical protein NE237_000923 [Protea cynaroides]|uniref:Uncharacterized protein n=1 Tax=Protea cynaroides TaxID=273540 RepID=A0A9Q0KS52_9MAGN|nr:hypothetical protein NE237_000923 [Protea cynaroides]
MMEFRVGDEVEVVYVKKWRCYANVVSGWVPATILEVYGSVFEPRPEDEYDRILKEGQLVEIRLNNELWIPGKVWEVYYHGIVGTNNISYSVQAMNISWAGRLTTYPLSRSEVRVRREWVDGEWVDPLIKSRDSSTETAALQRLGIGAKVEIFLDFMGGWKLATIEGFQGNQIKVRNRVWSLIKGCHHKINQFYDVSLVRPQPPEINYKKITFNLHQEVEVCLSYNSNDDDFKSWYVGEVLEIYSQMLSRKIISYTISHPKVGMINASQQCVRVRREWVDDKWIQYIEQRKMEGPRLVEVEVEVYSLHRKQWIPGTISESIENQIEVNIRMRHYGEYEILLVDASKVRPRLLMEKDNNLIYKENEVVEVFSSNSYWIKEEIWEIHATRTNLFYFVKIVDNFKCVYTVSKSKVRTLCLLIGPLCFERSTNSTVVKQRKFEDAQFYVGAKVEIFNVYKDGWEPDHWSGSMMRLVRPKLQLMEEENHQIFQLHDEVEILEKILERRVWCVRRIFKVSRREDELIYFVSHPTSAYVCIKNNDEIRIHKEWRDGEWIRPLSDSSADHHQVEVYSLKTHGWSSTIILQSYKNHIEVDVLINGKKWIMHVDASRIRPPRPEMENDQKFNWGDFIEVRLGESWLKGEIWNIHSKKNNIIYIILQSSSISLMKAEMWALWNWVDGKWVLPFFGTSLQPVSNFYMLQFCLLRLYRNRVNCYADFYLPKLLLLLLLLLPKKIIVQ